MKTNFVNVSDKKIEKINKNYLKAFEGNFKPISIEKEDKLYMIYQNGNRINHCTSIEELNGWLYGCVQSRHNRIEREDEI